MKNYFEMLDLPESLTLDSAHLRKQYFARQRQFHPDNAHDAASRLEMLQISADINAAYNVLKDNELRLYYVLKLRGVDILADGVAVPQYVLLQAMELREEKMEAEANQFALKMQAMRSDLLEKAIEAVAAQDWQQATNHAINLRYIPS